MFNAAPRKEDVATHDFGHARGRRLPQALDRRRKHGHQPTSSPHAERAATRSRVQKKGIYNHVGARFITVKFGPTSCGKQPTELEAKRPHQAAARLANTARTVKNAHRSHDTAAANTCNNNSSSLSRHAHFRTGKVPREPRPPVTRDRPADPSRTRTAKAAMKQ